jgi:Bacteriophage tail sheath protein
MNAASVPGVYRRATSPPGGLDLPTSVALFLGYTTGMAHRESSRPSAWSEGAWGLTSWLGFLDACGAPDPEGYLADAVRGFFDNGGERCYVIPLDPRTVTSAEGAREAIDAALQLSKEADDIDLLCVPDAARYGPEAAAAIHQQVLDSAASEHRFAIFDSLPDRDLSATVAHWQQLDGANGALYYPWVIVSDRQGRPRAVPPCGHVAGVFARTDREAGVFRAPANQTLHGAHDLTNSLTDPAQRSADPAGVVNCLRVFPARGIRVWGARTTTAEPAWRYINVVRLFQTVARWMACNLADVVMEPHDVLLWARIRREVNDYLFKLFGKGALKGTTPQEAYFLKCDEETTPPALRDLGQVVVEVGLAPIVPAEFIIVRFVYGEDGLRSATLAGSSI